jgi:hypothetical protein
VSAPIFSPSPGTYATAQTVTISDATPGAVIHYTTNGTTPTASSPTYTAPINVSSTETLQAIAVLEASAGTAANSEAATAASDATAAAATQSTLVSSSTSASYMIVTTPPQINYSAGFTASGMQLNGGSKITSGTLGLTDGSSFEARSAWYSTTVPVNAFTTDFTFLLTTPNADGFTFAIQNGGLGALGGEGGSLGYQGIGKSVAVKFDLYNNGGEGTDSTGVYSDGASPTIPATDLSSTGINLHSGHVIKAHLAYDGTTLSVTLTDTTTNATVTEQYPINIPATVGGNSAYVGFTAGSGGNTAVQTIQNWTYTAP